jgi:hypothetical protein
MFSTSYKDRRQKTNEFRDEVQKIAVFVPAYARPYPQKV